MPTPVIMPKFEMAQETGTISSWLKNEGDRVEKGEAILEVETDKVNMEVESPASGLLIGIEAGPGAVVPIGQPIAYIIQPGEPWPGKDQPALTPTERVTPLAERVAEAHQVDLQAIPHPGVRDRITKADVEAYLAQQAPALTPTPTAVAEKVKAVPAARRLSRELNVALERVSGTGPGGRIQSTDVRQAAARQPQLSTTPVSSPPLPPTQEVDGSKPALRRQIPLTGIRRTIAERMTASVREIPQFTVSVDVEMSRALAIVEDWRGEGEAADTPRITLTSLMVKACAWALLRHPAINATYAGDSIAEWADINIGVAVAVPEGLVVPVIRQVDQLGLSEISGRLAELANRARTGQLRLEDVQAGTFTISNLGMFGVDRFTAILNPPQAAILAVGRVARQAVVMADDRIEVRPIASLTLTADHRVVDGVLAGRFLADLQRALERPGILL